MNVRMFTKHVQTTSEHNALRLRESLRLVQDIFLQDMHAARVASLANAVAGVLACASVCIHAIGAAYAALADITAKSGVKQIDRLLSNDGLNTENMQRAWVRHAIGERGDILVAMDWTEFDNDTQSTLCIYLVTTHGRAMPLVWKTVYKNRLKGHQVRHERELIERLHEVLDPQITVTLLADRGFGNVDHYELLESLQWDFVIRFRQGIYVTDAAAERRTAKQWTPSNGRAIKLDGARVTGRKHPLAAVVCVKRKKMKEAWCLATSLGDVAASEVVSLYGRRFSIEETFRDTKDLKFGMGLRATHIRTPARRDRLLMIVALAHTMLTLLGAASEAAGMDAYLKVNTVKRRTHSLYRQGLHWYHRIPSMRQDWLIRLMTAYERILATHESVGMILAHPGPTRTNPAPV